MVLDTVLIFFTDDTDMMLCLQNSSTENQKRNSVRHKLVSLTLKRKSKITEEVSLKKNSKQA